MKTQTFSKIAVITFILLAYLMPAKICAQIANPYKVKNATGCSIHIDYAIQKTPSCTTCIGSAATIPPGGVFTLPSTCGTPCNVLIYLNEINGIAVPVTEVDMTNPTNSVTSSNCGSTPVTYNLTWSNGSTIIN